MTKSARSAMLGAVLILCYGCGFDDAASEGIHITEDGLAVAKVYTSDGNEKLSERTFKYGQKIYTNFEDVTGFTYEDDHYFPQMSVHVVSKTGDTVLTNLSLFEPDTGFKKNTNTLNGHVILATPINSGIDYTVHYTVRDTKGTGMLSSKMDFSVIGDDRVKVQKKGFDFKEAYVMSQTSGTVITDGNVTPGNQLLLDLQGLSGYVIQNERVSLGLSTKVTDASGTVLVDDADAFKGRQLQEAMVQQGVAGTLTLSEGRFNNPITWQVRIWDKNGDAELIAETEITVAE